jgi:hypothetical protein
MTEHITMSPESISIHSRPDASRRGDHERRGFMENNAKAWSSAARSISIATSEWSSFAAIESARAILAATSLILARTLARLAAASAMINGLIGDSMPVRGDPGICVFDDFSEFSDTTVFPVVDGADADLERTRCLLVTQSLADDQTNRRLFIVGQKRHRTLECSTSDERHHTSPLVSITRGRIGIEVDTGLEGPPVSKLLARTTVSLLTVVALPNQVLTHPEEITHGDITAFKILDSIESKKDLLCQILGPLRGGQSPQKAEHPIVIGLEKPHHDGIERVFLRGIGGRRRRVRGDFRTLADGLEPTNQPQRPGVGLSAVSDHLLVDV